jgi:sulfatase maturation enzyme AslB (radical SAM superfamily)
MKFFKKMIKNILPYWLVSVYQEYKREKTEKTYAYYCATLTGMSGYNISINSDLSISCSCQDSKGEGKLGCLEGTTTIRSVFFGEKANAMRAELAKGNLPITICSGCPELRKAPKCIAEYYRKHFEMPVHGMMIENCVLCNYHCKYCPRKESPIARTPAIISIDNMKYIAEELKKNKIEHISFFKLGEPFFDKDIHIKLHIIREMNPEITLFTSTNGLLIDNSEKVEAALLFDCIYFSVDGINTEMQEKYQPGADYKKIMDNVKMIVKWRGNTIKPILIWKYVVFSWNDRPEHISEVFKKAVEIGFDRVLFLEGGVSNIEDRTKRYYRKDFIPEDSKYNLIRYEAGYGMEFDLQNKNGA